MSYLCLINQSYYNSVQLLSMDISCFRLECSLLLLCKVSKNLAWGKQLGHVEEAQLHRKKPVEVQYVQLGGDPKASPEQAEGIINPI